MNHFLQLKKTLENTGIYSFEEQSIGAAEIQAYSAGLSLISSKIDVLYREMFTQTAKTFGIDVNLRLMNVFPMDTLVKRRKQIISQKRRVQGTLINADLADDTSAFRFAFTIDHKKKVASIASVFSLNILYIAAVKQVSDWLLQNIPPNYMIVTRSGPFAWRSLEESYLSVEDMNTYCLPWSVWQKGEF